MQKFFFGVVVCSLCSFQVVICIYCTVSRFRSTSIFFADCFVIFYFPLEIVGFADGKGAIKIIINFCTQIFGLINGKKKKNSQTKEEMAGGRYEMKRDESFQRLIFVVYCC